MKMLYKIRFFLVILLFPIIANALGTFVYDPAAVGQLMSQLKQMHEQTKIFENQTKLIQRQLAHLENDEYNWSNAQDLINELGSIVKKADGIAYDAGSIDQTFKLAFPGYQPEGDYSKKYEENTRMTLNTLNGVLQSVGSNAQDFANENRRLQFLQKQSQNAEGQTQAIQASSQIASETVSQIQLLRQTVIAQINAQTVYYASQIQNEASAKAEFEKVVTSGSQTVPAYGSSGHPLNPP